MNLEFKAKRICCPNCARHILGAVDCNKAMIIVCDRCGVKIYSKQISPKTYLLKVTLAQQDN